MNLTKKDERDQILQIRTKLEEDAKKISGKQRIKCHDLKLLEQVVFDFVPVTLGNEENIPKQYRGKTVYFKYIALDSDTLRKLDLSELSFDDVVWIGNIKNRIEKLFNSDICKYICTDKPFYENEIDFEHMNAKVDLTKSALVKYLGMPVCVSDVSFFRTDLSNNKLKNFRIYNSNIAYTGIELEYPKTKESRPKLLDEIVLIPVNKCGDCDLLSVREDGDYAVLQDCDCNGLKTFANWPTIGWGFFNEESRVSGFNSSFKNTGLKFGIKETVKDFRYYIGYDYMHWNTWLPNKKRRLFVKTVSRTCGSFNTEPMTPWKKMWFNTRDYLNGTVNLLNAFRSNLLDGCYLNGIKILSASERASKKHYFKHELQTLKQQLLDAKYNSFDIPGIGRK